MTLALAWSFAALLISRNLRLSYQPAVLFSQNKLAINNQPTV
jgi:hypothetical protein